MPDPVLLLRTGARGEAVRDLQWRLGALGYGHAPDEAGVFGAATTEAVRRFQHDRGLQVDGVVGRNVLVQQAVRLDADHRAGRAEPAAAHAPDQAALVETTRPGLMELVRAAIGETLPAAAFVGGTEIYFTEINRTRPEAATWDGVCYSITPQIHAFTDVDLVENLDAQAETVRSAQALTGDGTVVVSPITMRRRVNFHAAADPPPDVPGELPDSVDVRQSSLLGAAWTAGSVKYVAEAGAGSVTYYETTGWRGVLERAVGSELPDAFRSAAGEVFPLYHPLADAIEWDGAEVLACESSDVLAAVGLAVRTEDGNVRLLVANLEPREHRIVVAPVTGALALRRLNESTAAEAATDPAAFRRRWESADASGELELTLAPYEVVRIDPA